jgi:hypothetical protein
MSNALNLCSHFFATLFSYFYFQKLIFQSIKLPVLAKEKKRDQEQILGSKCENKLRDLQSKNKR